MSSSPVGAAAERVVLGALLDGENTDFLQDAMSWLSPEAFGAKPHQHVFRAVADLYLDGIPIGLESVRERMAAADTIGAIGGYPGLTDLTHAVLTEPSAAPRQYLAVLADALQAHNAAVQLRDVAERLGNGLTVDEARDQVEGVLSQTSHTADSLPDIADQVAQFRIDLQEQIARGPGVHGIPTGYRDLDGTDDPHSRRIIGGLRPGWLVYIGARPSVGKTTIMMDWARAACKAGHGAYIASTEMGANELLLRLIVAECATVNLRTVLNQPDQLTPMHLAQLENAQMEVMSWHLVIDDMAADMPTIARNAAAARAKFRAAGADLDIIYQDYIQLLQAPPGVDSGSNYARVTANSTRAKLLAKRLAVPFVSLVQLKRPEGSADREPRLDDFKDSGQIEQDADIALALERKYATDAAAASTKGYLPEDMSMYVLKHRHGTAGAKLPRAFIGERALTLEVGGFTNRDVLKEDSPPSLNGSPTSPATPDPALEDIPPPDEPPMSDWL